MKFDIGQPDPLFSNLLQMMRERAAEQADSVVYNFLVDGDRQENKVTCAELDALASRIGGFLQEKKLKGERALLLYPPGIDYIAAFFGCIYGGVIAVPAYPPDPYRLSRTLLRLKSILQDSGAKLILTTQEIRSMAETIFAQDPELARLEWTATDQLEEAYADSWKPWTPKEDDLVFLQYTSGSTGSPKGVMLAHRNLLSNMHLIRKAFQIHPDQLGFSWLPPYHDMGLIGGILTPLYGGGRTILMSPLDFSKNPLSWLRMVHRYGAEISGGPNFAFDLCVRKATPEFIQEIDLSPWKLAFSGAEPVRSETLKRFAETFAPSGFKMKSFYPCYGLAEGALMVSGGKKADPPVLKRVLRKSLECHRPEAAGEEDEGGVWLVKVWRNSGS
jgi:acyl-CoA synthetase (AMP-forming)/AMP-acid ligase II